MTSTPQPTQQHASPHDLIMQNLRPLMVLPATGPAQTEAMSFFEFISIQHLNVYHPSDSWRETLMFFSQTVPAVRYAATALALLQRNHLERSTSDHARPPASLEERLPDEAPLRYYNRAIQLLLNKEGGDSLERTAITLLVCYLFTCFDELADNYTQSMKHLRGGVELSRSISTESDASSSGMRTFLSQITRQIRRLDRQAVTFLVDWTPMDIEDTSLSQMLSSRSTFQSLDQATDYLQILVARVMKLFYTEQQMAMMGTPPAPSPKRFAVRGQLEAWSTLFGNMLKQGGSYETDLGSHRLISLLRLQYTVVWILISVSGPGSEMEYDNFLPQFQQCVALASDVMAAHEPGSGSLKATFTPEVGLVPVLFIVGAKCRHPIVRREVLRILRHRPIREAVWDSRYAARVIERVVEIEESLTREEEAIRSMDQIGLWQRIESLSWVHVTGQGVDRLDIAYMFCGWEDMHMESLMI